MGCGMGRRGIAYFSPAITEAELVKATGAHTEKTLVFQYYHLSQIDNVVSQHSLQFLN